MKSIYVAGGCFWGVGHYYSLLKGVVNTTVGYANSELEDINYEQTCSGEFQAVEAVLVEYDETLISLDKIIEHLFRMIDPTSLNKQGGDIGVQYRVGIYSCDLEELKYINNVVNSYQKNYSDPIVLEVSYLDNFYNAEEYHQKYLYKNPDGYCHISMHLIKDSEKKGV